MAGGTYGAGPIQALQAAYDMDSGLLGQLRQGTFDRAGLERVIVLLSSIKRGDGPTIERRLVARLWKSPTIMTWQTERVFDSGVDRETLRHGSDRVQAAR